MRSDAALWLFCDVDGCDYREEFYLTPTVRDDWDERDVDLLAQRAGWTKRGSKDICPNHSEEQA